ncbi:MAG: hypothetical protein KI793_01915 [Rivularia sp. (in: Bacteria)]|nr:hypothetical protein [Rivularia sp. MS3]
MKLIKLLSLSLVPFVLFGCNQTPAASSNDNAIKSSISQKQDSDSTSETTTVNTNKLEESNPKITAREDNTKDKIGKQIGGKFDCNGDGIFNGARIDYDGDGIPDECIESYKKAKSAIDETSYQTVSKSLESITKGCKETEKNTDFSQYKICKKGDRIVNVSEYASEAGAGLAYWFAPNGKVVAIRNLSSGVLSTFDSNGKVSKQFDVYKSKRIKNINAQERKNLEQNVYNGYKQIIAAFNNTSTTTASSQSGIIDETSYQTVSKSIESITKGCTKTKKTEDNLDFEICKKGDTVVSVSEYAPEADAGSVYWLSPDGRVLAMRYFGSGDTYVFDSNYRVSSKFNVYKSKKVNNISADERERVKEDSHFRYRRILDVFNL